MNKAAYAIWALIITMLIIIGTDTSYDDELAELKEACELHAIWLQDAETRVKPENRRGWPVTYAEYERKCND